MLFTHLLRVARSIWALSLDDGTAAVLIDDPNSIQNAPRFSPDGKWIAYHSNESEVFEVYLQPFPLTGRKQRLVDGHHPIWSRDGQQLIFKTGPTSLGVVDIATNPSPTWDAPRTFPATTRPQGPMGSQVNDVMRDGRVIVVDRNEAAGLQSQINIVLNFFEELKERVPVP